MRQRKGQRHISRLADHASERDDIGRTVPVSRPLPAICGRFDDKYTWGVRKMSADGHRKSVDQPRRTEVDGHNLTAALWTAIPARRGVAIERERDPVSLHVRRNRLN